MFERILKLDVTEDIQLIRKLAPPLMHTRLNQIELYLTNHQKQLCQTVLALLQRKQYI